MPNIELSPELNTREDFEKIIDALWDEAKARDWEDEYASIMRKAGLTKYLATKCQLEATVKFRVPATMTGNAGVALSDLFGPSDWEHVTRHIHVDHPPRQGVAPGGCVCPENEAQALTWVKEWVAAKFATYVWPEAGQSMRQVDLVTRIEYGCPSPECSNR